jgi:hypothetical protein
MAAHEAAHTIRNPEVRCARWKAPHSTKARSIAVPRSPSTVALALPGASILSVGRACCGSPSTRTVDAPQAPL